MPYIPNEEELARQEQWKLARENKEKPMREAFNNLTDTQKDVLRFVSDTMLSFDQEMIDLEGDCYHSTMQSVRTVGYKVRNAFPNLKLGD
jgi:hypothetical protein